MMAIMPTAEDGSARKASGGSRRSPLAFVVLALLYEEPMHPYRMHKLVHERGKQRIVNVVQRNSIQQTVNRLLRDELIEVVALRRPTKYPEQVVYGITEAGTELLFMWLDEMLSAPAAEYPQFPAALAFLALTTPRQAVAMLTTRRDALAERVDELAAEFARAPERLARVLLVEEEYRLAMLRAELAWLDGVLAELADGSFAWDTAELVEADRRHREPED